jgi:fission process protein 1
MMSPTAKEKEDEVQSQIEEGPTRYAAFAMRLRTLITASSRYIAYSSDIGEAFRPLTNPIFVRSAYGISWAYILGDCGYAGYLAHKQRQGMLPAAADTMLSPAQKVELRRRQLESGDANPIKWNPLEASEPMHVGLVVARRAVFQSLASMALPAFTIHSIVRYSAPLFAKAASQRVRASGPTVAGLAAVPALVSILLFIRFLLP